MKLARRAAAKGEPYPAIYNAANEVAVDAFHDGALPFVGIVDTVAEVVGRHDGGDFDAHSLDGVLAADRWAREVAAAVVRG